MRRQQPLSAEERIAVTLGWREDLIDQSIVFLFEWIDKCDACNASSSCKSSVNRCRPITLRPRTPSAVLSQPQVTSEHRYRRPLEPGRTARQASIVLRISSTGILALRIATLLNSARVCSNGILEAARIARAMRSRARIAFTSDIEAVAGGGTPSVDMQ